MPIQVFSSPFMPDLIQVKYDFFCGLVRTGYVSEAFGRDFGIEIGGACSIVLRIEVCAR